MRLDLQFFNIYCTPILVICSSTCCIFY